MSERILRVVKDAAPEKSPYQEVFDDGFKEGYARGSQQATEYYSQEIMSLHAQIFKLQQERSGNDQAPRLSAGSLLDRLKANGKFEPILNKLKANGMVISPCLIESDSNEPDLSVDEFF